MSYVLWEEAFVCKPQQWQLTEIYLIPCKFLLPYIYIYLSDNCYSLLGGKLSNFVRTETFSNLLFSSSFLGCLLYNTLLILDQYIYIYYIIDNIACMVIYRKHLCGISTIGYFILQFVRHLTFASRLSKTNVWGIRGVLLNVYPDIIIHDDINVWHL